MHLLTSIFDLPVSKFAKLATFMIVQTFFVSAISGGVLQVSRTAHKSKEERLVFTHDDLSLHATGHLAYAL